MELGLAGGKVLVTGGSQGIGLAIAKAFAGEGCDVAIIARGAAGLARAAAEIGGGCVTYAADVTDAAAVPALLADVERRWPALDVLVTNVGSGASVPPGREDAAEWARMMAVNFFAASNMVGAARPLLARAAAPAIVCVSSICGVETVPGAPVAYAAAKAALNAMVRGLARPLAAENIRINAVAPGNILVAGGKWARELERDPAAVQAMLTAEVAQARLGEAGAVADAVLYLASARAAFVTGTIQVVDGGQTRS